MSLFTGPSYSEGVRIEPNQYHLPEVGISDKILFISAGKGAEIQAGLDEKGIINIRSSAENKRFGDPHSPRSISLTGKNGILTDLSITNQSIRDTRASIIDLNFEGDDFNPEDLFINGIIFQSNGEIEGEDTSKIIHDDKGKEWDIVHPDRFTQSDVSNTIVQAIQNVEELLANGEISGHPHIARDIITILTGFGDDALAVMERFEQVGK